MVNEIIRLLKEASEKGECDLEKLNEEFIKQDLGAIVVDIEYKEEGGLALITQYNPRREQQWERF